ncbi:MAG TPA: glycoside hydrolase family 18 protein [Thermoanaerobaculia bacterium]
MKRSLILALLLIAGCRTLGPDVAPHRKFRIVGYVRGRADINAIGAKKLTHINYAFAKVNPLGVIELEDPDAPSHLAQLQALKAVNPDLKIIVSVGGWGADYFSDAALDDASRCRFADSAINVIKRYALDGIDLDWEYPGQPGPGIKFRAEDKENFTLLLKTLREELDMLSDARRRKRFDRYTLTIASAGGRYFEHTEMEKLHPFLDWINVMTYDFSGGWSPTTGHHTPLYRSAAAAQPESTETFIRQHLHAGIPPKKIVVGVAFYGRGWRGVIRDNSGLYQRYDQYESDYPYWKLLTQYVHAEGYEQRWDAAAHAPFLWNAEVGRFITYDDPRSLAEKARFVRTYGLGGIMYWEHSHDPSEVLLSTLYFALQ